MKHLRRFLGRVLALVRPGKAETDLRREIDAHLQLLEDKYIAQGKGRVEARAAARRAFGGVEQAKELQRDARTFRWLAGWPMDLKLGTRMLVKSPGLTVVAVIALAVAIGAGAAYFEFFNDFFRPTLRFPGGDRAIGIVVWDVAKNDVAGPTAYDFDRWRHQLRTVEALGTGRAIDQDLTTDDGRTEPVRGVAISASAFRVVPTAPILGRTLTDDDERADAPPVVVLGYDLWRTRFNSDTGVVGRTTRLGETPHTIVGVMPEEFAFPENQNLWAPLRIDGAGLKRGEGRVIRVYGRLAPGADLDAAQAELTTWMAAAPDAAAFRHLRPNVKPYVESIVSMPNMAWQMRVLYAFNLFFIGLLGICGANVATLVFARTATRESEITVRTALGASRARIVSQLVAEALVLATLAAIVGLGGASVALKAVRNIFVEANGEPMPFWWNEQIGPETIAYTCVLVVFAALLVGGVPGWKATGAVMQSRLKQAGASGSTMRFGKLWTGIIVSQVAITLVFLVSTVSLAWGTLSQERKLNELALPRHEYLTARINSVGRLPADRAKAALREIERRLSLEPAAASVTFTTRFPGRNQEEFWVDLPSKAMQDAAFARANNDVLTVGSTRVASNYFEALDQPIVAGRMFTPGEAEAGRPVAVVDETFVRLILGGTGAIGQMVREAPHETGREPGPWLEIVGVVRDISTLPEKKTEDAMLYRPFTLRGADNDAWPWRVMIHARGDVTAPGTPLRLATAATDPDLRLEDVLPLDRVGDADAATMNFFVRSLGVIAAIALLLSTAGIYSLISFTLARRSREIGIRVALGAAPRRIMRDILSTVFVQIAMGLVLGAIPGITILTLGLEEANGATRISAAAGTTFGIALFVITIAAIACLGPLRRAMSIEPTQALRADM